MPQPFAARRTASQTTRAAVGWWGRPARPAENGVPHSILWGVGGENAAQNQKHAWPLEPLRLRSQGVSRAYTKATPACTNECCKHGLPNWIHVTLRLPAVACGVSAAPAGPAPPLAAPQPRSCSRTASRPILDSPRQLQERGRPAGPSPSTPWCATAYAAAGALVGCVPSAGDGQTRCHGQTVPRGGGMADLLREAESLI